jgi:tetratricopeptide (TPR) repeat protein
MGPLRYPDAEERIAHYQRIAAENQNDVVRALLFNHLGYLESERKNFAQGYTHYTAQVQIARDLLAHQGESDDYVVDLVSSALQNLGTCQLDMGEIEAALQTHQSAYDFARQHDLRYRWPAPCK